MIVARLIVANTSGGKCFQNWRRNRLAPPISFKGFRHAGFGHTFTRLLCHPTLPDAIQPKGLLRIAHMAVRNHIGDTMDLQHETGRNHAWLRHCQPFSYTIAIVHRAAMAIAHASKPAGGSMAQTRASANVSGCDTRIRSAIDLTVGMSFRIPRRVALTNRASDSARCSAPPATFSRFAACSKLWLGHAGYSRRPTSSVSNRVCRGYAMPNRMRAMARKLTSNGALCAKRMVSDSPTVLGDVRA
jgi:hypothetical protein